MRRNKACPLYSQLRLKKRTSALRHVRFTLESGHVQRTRPCLLWANSGHLKGSDFAKKENPGTLSGVELRRVGYALALIKFVV